MAQEEYTPSTLEDFVVNNSVFVLFHEVGHLLIGELGIPILGKEEDAADNLAALLLIAAETVETDQVLIDSADGWFLSDAANTAETFEDAEFYDVHSLDVQRAFQVVCLMVGADTEVFGEIADNVGLDIDRQESCITDFGQTSQSWNAVLEPFLAPEGHSTEIYISYDPTENYVGVQELLRSEEILELTAHFVLQDFALPRPVTLRVAECGEPNAFYDPDPGEIIFCYELADHFAGLYAFAETLDG
jgi:hypothetical protein